MIDPIDHNASMLAWKAQFTYAAHRERSPCRIYLDGTP
jgi:hypothetical protein